MANVLGLANQAQGVKKIRKILVVHKVFSIFIFHIYIMILIVI